MLKWGRFWILIAKFLEFPSYSSGTLHHDQIVFSANNTINHIWVCRSKLQGVGHRLCNQKILLTPPHKTRGESSLLRPHIAWQQYSPGSGVGMLAGNLNVSSSTPKYTSSKQVKIFKKNAFFKQIYTRHPTMSCSDLDTITMKQINTIVKF